MTFSVGDLVRLNANGLRQIHGLRNAEQIQAYNAGVRITNLEPAFTDPPVNAVDLEPPFDILILTEWDIEYV